MNSSNAVFAAALNNEGIAHLEARCYDQAIEKITKSLGLVREQLSLTQSKCNGPNCCVCSTCKSISEGNGSDTFCFRDRKLSQHGILKRPSLDEVVDDEDLFIFTNPMLITMKASPPHCYNYYVGLSFIVLFNLALAYHQHGSRTNCQLQLQKALRLYELAYTVHIKEDLTLTVMQALAIVNNLGHLHALLGNKESSQKCFDNLLSTLMYIQEYRSDDVDAQHVDGFMSNVLSSMLTGPKSAAAA
mmetsp:Transcript_5196/g.10687  ORF Transcript_5196/g.10687 Transcript_5196/m.10687 type:complete len:245 (-) Transcript_5196:183-917(-)